VPELPDITVYLEALEARIAGQPLEKIRLHSPFLLRSIDPEPRALEGRRVIGFRRIGKRIAIAVEEDLWMVLHLMIAGRLHWRKRGAALHGRQYLAAWDFPNGSLVLTEAGTKRRASLTLIRGEANLAALDPGGINVANATAADFADRLQSENHTVKRSLTDPHLFSGIGNAYSDEILHRARMSPLKMTQKLTHDEIAALLDAAKSVLREWVERLRAEAAGAFPEKVTAFRDGMAVHGRFHQPCPVCGAKIQRIRYAGNETNYCARCQTGGKLLADRAMSRLLREDWPRSLDELEESPSD
jgi:formamidopyrimidine-DNA glycosylase